MEIVVLASGSSGNAVLFASGGDAVLVDAGLSATAIRRRLGAAGRSITEVSALLLTHEHSDHTRGVDVLARRDALPVWATAGTWSALESTANGGGELESGHPVRFGGLTVLPVATVHDAREPVAVVIEDGSHRVGLCTDTGVMTPLLMERLRDCDLLLLEANHDKDMLRHGPYPWLLKQRISSRHGHLANHQTREALDRLIGRSLKGVVGMHLSEKNNRVRLVREVLRGCLPEAVTVETASRTEMLLIAVNGAGVRVESRAVPPPSGRKTPA